MDINGIARLEGRIKLRRRLRTDGDEAVVQELLDRRAALIFRPPGTAMRSVRTGCLGVDIGVMFLVLFLFVHIEQDVAIDHIDQAQGQEYKPSTSAEGVKDPEARYCRE